MTRGIPMWVLTVTLMLGACGDDGSGAGSLADCFSAQDGIVVIEAESLRTNDNDAHTVVVEVSSAGEYTMQIAARGDFMQLDRIVLRDANVPADTAEDLSREETRCR